MTARLDVPVRRFRSTGQLVIITVFAALIVAAGALEGSRLSFARGSIAVVLDLVIAGVMVAGPGRVALFTTSEGVRVRSSFSSRTIPWGDIRRFRIGPCGFSKVCIVDLVDGGSVPAFGISVPNQARDPSKSGEQRMVDELNSMLDADRGAARAA